MGGWRLQEYLPKGVFGCVLVRKEKGENFSWAGRAVLKYRTGQNFFFGALRVPLERESRVVLTPASAAHPLRIRCASAAHPLRSGHAGGTLVVEGENR